VSRRVSFEATMRFPQLAYHKAFSFGDLTQQKRKLALFSLMFPVDHDNSGTDYNLIHLPERHSIHLSVAFIKIILDLTMIKKTIFVITVITYP